MADVKWIKITTDIFDDEKILLIESMPDADAVIVIWFKLLCLAGKQNNSGVFTMNDKIAYTEEMLATIFRRPVNTVRMALNTFENFGMIEVVDGVITIPKWGKHQNFDKIEKNNEYHREYMKEYRKKQKTLCEVNSEVNSEVNVNALDKIREEEIREDKNREDKSRKDSNKRFTPPTLDQVKDYIFEKGYSVDGEYWFNYYQSNGWKVGRNKMVDWQACIAQWNARDKEKQKQSNKRDFMKELEDA